MIDRRELRRSFPLTISDDLLASAAMQQACTGRDFGEIFRLVNRRAGISYAEIAAAIGKFTTGRVGDVISGSRHIRSIELMSRIADAFGIPGGLLDLPPRPWESPSLQARTASRVHEDDLLETAEDLRRSMDRALFSEAVSTSQIDALEDRVARNARMSLFMLPMDMLRNLLRDFDDIRELAAISKQPRLLARLYRAAAQIAALTADEMMVIGDIRQAWAWHATAKTAADATDDRATQAQVVALGTLIPLYYGDAGEAAILARAASELGRDGQVTPTAASTLALNVEALALAQLDDATGSRERLALAMSALEALDDSHQVDSVFGFTQRRALFYQGRTYAELGETAKAWQVQEQALAQYPNDVVGDRAIIYLDRARQLVRDGETADGCMLANRTLSEMPARHRTEIFLNRGARVLTAIPEPASTQVQVCELSDLIATIREDLRGQN
ncbi:transcriptional regulator with XRE-family HTH domain [Streptacidiphilus sp. MAP12-20]|uniref:hypothetical protein n=1 Tax=Streptacidiphilus sp. MAP12-20 TaxID=3156299 RepID=UPI0035168D07